MYYWLQPKDQRRCSWVFFEPHADKLVKSALCSRISCKLCGKFDELTALQQTEKLTAIVKSRDDFILSDDGVVFVSDRLKEILIGHNEQTFELLRLPTPQGYSIMIPRQLIQVDAVTCGMEFHRLCRECNRYRETCLFPLVESMNLESFDWLIASPSIIFENIKGRVFWFLAKKPLIMQMKEQKIKGLEYGRA